MSLLNRLLPADPSRFAGPTGAVALLAAYNVAGTARSLVHIIVPDSGAGTIASIDTRGDGGANAISLLAQWGGAQFLESGMIWVAVLRYRGLVPLMWATVTAEQALRVGIGRRKKLVTAHTPPGAASRYLLSVSAAALVWSLTARR